MMSDKIGCQYCGKWVSENHVCPKKKLDKEEEIISISIPPCLKVEWYHLEKFLFGDRPLIWIHITNTGGACTLFTSGEIQGQVTLSLGLGEYEIEQNETLELGFFRSNHDTLIIQKHMLKDEMHFAYYARLVAVNESGYDIFEEGRTIPVIIPK